MKPTQADRDLAGPVIVPFPDGDAILNAIATAREQGRQEGEAELAAVKERYARALAETSRRSAMDAEQFARVQEERSTAWAQLAAIREAAKPLNFDLRKLLAAIGA